ncbi:MAG TPA: hypothetical protein VGK19_24040 [Capsulimonadaceae bacterium]|jgi:hypothetical protein
MAKFNWERIDEPKLFTSDPIVSRARVPGGWLIWTRTGELGGLTFYPDPDHSWNGETLDTSPDSDEPSRQK